MAISKETQAKINMARKDGYSDAEIFNHLKTSPKYKNRFTMAKKDGYTEGDIAQQLGLNITITVKQPEQPKYEKPSFLADVGAGMDDVFSGIKQGALYLKDGVTGGNDYEKFTKEKADEKAFYEKARTESGAGTNFGRFVGQTVATLPAAAFAKGYQGVNAATKAGRVVQAAGVTGQNALSGAAAGGVMFAKDADERLKNTQYAAAGGAIGGVIAHPIGKGIAKLNTKLSPNASSRASARMSATIDDQIEIALTSRNIRMSDLSDDILRGLRKDVGAALKSGKAVNKEAVARKVVFDRLGITPTRAQLTGDPKLWNKQAELAKIHGAGDPLRDKLIQDNEKLSTLMDDFVTKTDGQAIDQYGAMSKAVDALDNHNATMKQQVGQMYDAAKSAQGNDVLLDGAGFANDAITRLDADYAMSSLPQNIHKLMKDVADNPDKFTLGKSEEFIKILNREHKASLQNGQPTSTTHAIGVVRDALTKRQEQAMQGLLTQGNNDAAQMYNLARTAHKMRVEQIEANPLLKAAAKGEQPDKLFNKHILGGNIAELESTVKLLRSVDTQAVNDIRGQVAKYIMDKTLQSNGQPSPAAMAKALGQIGDRRLNILFSPEEVAKLKDIGSAMHYLITQPPHSYVNNSNTASAAMNFLGNILNRPGVRLALSPLKDVQDSVKVNRALKGSVASDAKASNDMLDNILYGEEEKKLIDILTKLGVIGGANTAK